MSYSDGAIWLIIAGLGLGTFLIRFSFLGLLGSRTLPPIVMDHLRYTAVAIIPGLVAPLVIWSDAEGSGPASLRIAIALAVLYVGWRWKSTLAGIGLGAVLLGLLWAMG